MQVAANDMGNIAAMMAKQAAALQNILSQGSQDGDEGGQEKADEGPKGPPPGSTIAAIAYSGSGASAGSVFAAAVMTNSAAPPAPVTPVPAEDPVAAPDAEPTFAERAEHAAKVAANVSEHSQMQIEKAQARADKYADWVGRWDAKLEEAGIDPATGKVIVTDPPAADPVVAFAGFMMGTAEDGSTTIFAAMSTTGGDEPAEVPLTDEQQAMLDKAMHAREVHANVSASVSERIGELQARADRYNDWANRWAERAGINTDVADAEVIEETPAAATTTAETAAVTEAAETTEAASTEASYSAAASGAATTSSSVNDFFAFLSQMHEDNGMEYDGVVYTSTDGAEFSPVTEATVETAEIAETVAPAEDDAAAAAPAAAAVTPVAATGVASGLAQFGSFEALFAPLFDFMSAFQQAFAGFQQQNA